MKESSFIKRLNLSSFLSGFCGMLLGGLFMFYIMPSFYYIGVVTGGLSGGLIGMYYVEILEFIKQFSFENLKSSFKDLLNIPKKIVDFVKYRFSEVNRERNFNLISGFTKLVICILISIILMALGSFWFNWIDNIYYKEGKIPDFFAPLFFSSFLYGFLIIAFLVLNLSPIKGKEDIPSRLLVPEEFILKNYNGAYTKFGYFGVMLFSGLEQLLAFLFLNFIALSSIMLWTVATPLISTLFIFVILIQAVCLVLYGLSKLKVKFYLSLTLLFTIILSIFFRNNINTGLDIVIYSFYSGFLCLTGTMAVYVIVKLFVKIPSIETIWKKQIIYAPVAKAFGKFNKEKICFNAFLISRKIAYKPVS